jgi:hypothetical protein
MASINRYRCLSCNADLGADGATVESHLAANPTHSVEEVLFGSTKTLENIEGPTRMYTNAAYLSGVYIYDNARGIWLTANRINVLYSIPAATQNNVYQRLYGSMTPTTAAMGFLVHGDATIIGLTATRSAGTGTGIFSVRVYGAANLTSITLGAGVLSGTDSTINVNVADGTIISSYLTGSATSSYPQLVVELARRMS